MLPIDRIYDGTEVVMDGAAICVETPGASVHIRAVLANGHYVSIHCVQSIASAFIRKFIYSSLQLVITQKY